MPNYLYECRSCDIRVVVERSIDRSADIPSCLICNERLLRRYDFGLVSFKGEGFYSTDKKRGGNALG